MLYGVVAPLRCPFDCCILLAETWASWVTLCLRFVDTPVTIYWYRASEALCQAFSAASSLQWLTWNRLPPSPVNNSVVFIQGSTSFLAHVPMAYVTHPYVLAACGDDTPLLSVPTTWSSSVYDFSVYGGAIAGFCHIASSIPLPTSLSSSGAFLSTTRLRHFLISTVRGGLRFLYLPW
jgi:hypothetical protein